MQNSKFSKNLNGHRRTHSSSDYDISKFSKNSQISPISTKISVILNDPTPNSTISEGHTESSKKKNQEITKEYIIEPLEMTAEQQRILAGSSQYNAENLNFGKNYKKPTNNLFYNSSLQLFNSNHNKEAIVEKYRKQLEEQKISTILEKNDILSNDDSSFLEIDKLSPINKNLSDNFSKAEEKRTLFRKKKFHSNSQDLTINKNLLSCGMKSNATHTKNSPSQQIFTIYLNKPNKNEKQLDKIISFLTVNKGMNVPGIKKEQSKNFSNNSSNIMKNHSSIGTFNTSQNANNTENQIKNLEKRIFLLENEMFDLRNENSVMKQNNYSLMKKMQEMGPENILQVIKLNSFLPINY